MNIPVPRNCADCRHEKRLNLRNPRKLWDRTCMCLEKDHTNHTGIICQIAIKTSYRPEIKEKVYCEKCYLQEVY